ncbi:MAG: hypothetical protein ACRBCJ_08720 [Hyphomicrobiaceae bacterium]
MDTQTNLEHRLEESYEKGFADGVSKAKKEASETRRSEHERQETQARLSLIQERIDGLVEEIIAQQKEKTLAIESMVSGVLKELIDEKGMLAAVRKIEGSIERELDGRTNTRIQLSGPEPIVSELADRLTMKNFAVDVSHSDIETASVLDVQVQIGSTLIRSRLSEWKQTMAELLV